PAQRIIDTFDSSLCLSTDCINTCINTIETIVVESTTLTTATLSWIDTSGSTQWNIRYHLNGDTPGNWTTVSSTSATFTNLTPNTYYVFEVTPICPNGLEIGGRTLLFMTADSYCTGSVFTDTGGATGDYDDEQTMVRTLIPNVPANNITLTFSVFDLELDYDYMYIYDGNSTAAPEFNNGIGFTGNTIPGPFESSAADGSLTIQFKSDQFVTEAGWVATIGCTPNLNATTFQGIDFTYAPNPTNGIVQIQSKTPLQSIAVYNVTGQLLYSEALKDTTTNVDISSFAPGTYFFSLQFDEDHTVHFKVIKK
ncbi:MAG: T9SS type A sorting domain-containing protein, partial [Flavobacterium stagni]